MKVAIYRNAVVTAGTAALMIALQLAVVARVTAEPVSFSYTATLHLKPKYYPGPMPLLIRYTIGVNEDILPEYRGELITLQSFEGWRNVFVYADPRLKVAGIPTKAIALDSRYRKLAEATLLSPTIVEKEGNKWVSGYRVREVHYAGSLESFVAESEIDRRGSKISEEIKKGEKTRDYFFLWPLDTFHQDKVQEVLRR